MLFNSCDEVSRFSFLYEFGAGHLVTYEIEVVDSTLEKGNNISNSKVWVARID